MPKSLVQIEAGNRAHTLHSYISVTDEVKFNEQKNSIATGHLRILQI